MANWHEKTVPRFGPPISLCGLARLGEPEQVLECLAQDAEVKQRIIEDEHHRAILERAVLDSSDAEFGALRSKIFQEIPALRRLFGNAGKESTALRIRLVECMRQEEMSRSDSLFGQNELGASK